MKKPRILALWTLGLALSLWAQAPDLTELLEGIRAKHKLPALGGAIVYGDSAVAYGAVGLRKFGGTEPVTADDLWHLGSCTKSMTATLIAILVEKEVLRWDLTLGEVFPDLEMHADYKAVTLELLCGNRSGVPGAVDRDLWGRLWKKEGSRPEQRMLLLRETLKAAPEAPPGTKNIYSNTGFAIAGAVAEKVTGKAWEDLIAEELFKPLGMKHFGFGAPGTPGQEDQPWGHKGAPGAFVAIEPGPHSDNPPAIGPAGIVHCSLADWAKYIALHSNGGDLLSEDSLRRLHTPLAGQDYAMGWVTCKRGWGGKGLVLNHNGSNTMWYCVAWVAPDKKFAVLAVTNFAGEGAAAGCDEVASNLIRLAQEHYLR